MSKYSSIIGSFLIFFLSCSNEEQIKKLELNIAVAANAQQPLEVIADLFMEENDTIQVNVISSSSGKLSTLIQQGAPYDFFFSANELYPRFLQSKDLIIGKPITYAYGKLILWSTQYELDATNWQDKIRASRSIAIANPELAPYGGESVRFLDNSGLLNQVSGKLIYGEHISQTNQYIASGASEIGITAKSAIHQVKGDNKGSWWSIPDSLYQPIVQSYVMTQYGGEQHEAACNLFNTFLKQEKVKQVFRDFGYGAN
ncbi:MAG: molybdate ABC transporter substrate-binding protein [Bacteroidota bacterium]